MQSLIDLTTALINIDSITPKDKGCQNILIKRLEKLGFKITKLPYQRTDNFLAQYGQQQPSFFFAGHTDVVPIGNIADWKYPPFDAVIQDDFIYGRGSADMKGSLAAMIIAVEHFLEKNKQFDGSINFLITSAEEGPSHDGTPILLKYLAQEKITMDYCIVGEPTSHKQFGDMIKNGRRGSLTGDLKVIGKQGHIAYPHLADNPIHNALDTIAQIINQKWCQGNQDFQASSFQISNINAGTGAGNVIPGELQVQFNIRYSPEITAEDIKKVIHQYLDNANLKYELLWTHFGKPYHTTDLSFLKICQDSIKRITGVHAELSTSGGTSDARYIAAHCQRLVELGPINATIHQVDECVSIKDLSDLSKVYYEILKKIFL